MQTFEVHVLKTDWNAKPGSPEVLHLFFLILQHVISLLLEDQ